MFKTCIATFYGVSEHILILSTLMIINICTASLAVAVNSKDVLSSQDAEKIWEKHVYEVKISCVSEPS